MPKWLVKYGSQIAVNNMSLHKNGLQHVITQKWFAEINPSKQPLRTCEDAKWLMKISYPLDIQVGLCCCQP